MLTEGKMDIKYKLAARWDYYGLPLILVLLLIVFSIMSAPFRSGFNLLSNIKFASFIGIAAVGMNFCIASGDFDISVGSMLALVAVLGGTIVEYTGGVPGVIITLLIGTSLGFINGFFVTKLRIPAFITTLGMLYIYRAVAFIFTDNEVVSIQNRFWSFLGNGKVAGIPFAIILMILCFAAGFIILRKTPFGRYVVAVGSNKQAAVLSGINFDRIKITVFTMTGFFVAISSIVMSANFGSANPGMMGQGFEFQVITAVVLGGTLLGGGSANLFGALFAACIITYLKNGLGLQQVNSYWQFVATGLVLIFAVAVNRAKVTVLGQQEV